MKKLIASTALCVAATIGAGAHASSPSVAHSVAVVSVANEVSTTAITTPLVMAQYSSQSAGYSQEESSSSTRVRGRGIGSLIKLVAVGVIAIGGWFLKWCLSD